MKKIFLFLISFLFIINVDAAINVEYDGFNVRERNYVKTLPTLSVKNANITITGSDAHYIKRGDYNNVFGEYGIYYEGPYVLGTSIGDGLHTNTIDATIVLRWNNGALLSDGGTADVVLTVTDIKHSVSNRDTSKPEPEVYYSEILYGDDRVLLYAENPKSSIAPTDYKQMTAEEKAEYDTGVHLGAEYKVNIKIVKSGTNTVIDTTKYPNMAFGAYDIDVWDNTVDLSSYTEWQEIKEARYRGQYVESIEFMNGVNSTIHLPLDTPLNNIKEQALIKAVTGPHGGTRIIPNAEKMANADIRAKSNDPETYYSGFTTMVSPAGLDFYWRGYGCGTALFNAQDVIIDQTHNTGGIVKTSTYGRTATLAEETHTSHEIGSSPTYTYPPLPGYHIEELKIDKVVTPPEAGYSHTFNSLVYNPLVRLNENEEIIMEDGKPVMIQNRHSIDILYAPNEFTVVYEDGGGKDGVEKMPDQSAKYGENIQTSKNEYAKDRYVFNNWLLYTETPDGVRTQVFNNDGTPYIVNDKAVLMNMIVPDGGKLVLVARWLQNEFIVEYDSGDANDDPTKMPPDIIKDTNDITAKENKFEKEHSKFTSWIVYIVDKDGNKTLQLNDNNETLYLPDKGELKNLSVPDDGKVLLVAQWVPNEVIIEYDSGDANDDPTKMPSDKLDDPTNVTAKENKFAKKGATFSEWEVFIVDQAGNKKPLLQDGKAVFIKDKGELKNLDIPDGGKVLLVAHWVENPQTGLESITWILSIALIAGVGYYYLNKKNYFRKA